MRKTLPFLILFIAIAAWLILAAQHIEADSSEVEKEIEVTY